MELNEVQDTNLEERESGFKISFLNPKYELLFDENVIDFFGIEKDFQCDENINASHGKVRVSGGRVHVPSTVFITSDNYKERREFKDYIRELVPSSKIFDIYGDVKDEYTKDDLAKVDFLYIHNSKKNLDLIEGLTLANENGFKYKGIKIPKLTIFADTEAKNIPLILRKNSLILEACSLDTILNLKSEEKPNFALREQRLKEVLPDPIKVETFINSLNLNGYEDIPNVINIKRYFKENTAIPRYISDQFLTTVKIITKLNQKKRHFFILEEENLDKKVYLTHPLDICYCFRISQNWFNSAVELPESFKFYSDYITKWVYHNPEVDKYKINKKLPSKQKDYFNSPTISKDLIWYIKNHPEFKNYLKSQDSYRRILLTLSGHPVKGQYNLLLYRPKRKSELNTPNEYKLNVNYVIKPFSYEEEKQHFFTEYYKYCENIIEKHEELGINLAKSKLPRLEGV